MKQMFRRGTIMGRREERRLRTINKNNSRGFKKNPKTPEKTRTREAASIISSLRQTAASLSSPVTLGELMKSEQLIVETRIKERHYCHASIHRGFKSALNAAGGSLKNFLQQQLIFHDFTVRKTIMQM